MHAIVPVKAPPQSKARLAHVLGPHGRSLLTTVLVEHVTSVLADAGLDPIVLSSGAIDPPERADVWPEERGGLNRALAAAIDRTGMPVLVVPADLPWLTPSDVEALLAEPGDVVIAAASDGGTNGLVLRAPVPPSFGAQSAFVHAIRARAAGLRARIVRRAGFIEDIDDGQALIRAKGSPALRGHPELGYARS